MLFDTITIMPVQSTLPQIDIPNVGIWDFLFERKDLDFPADKGKLIRKLMRLTH